MMKFKLYVVVAIAVGLVAACAPKSRYRAIDVTKSTTETNSTKKTTEQTGLSPIRPSLDTGVPAPEALTSDEDKEAAGKIEYVGVAKEPLPKAGEFSLDLFVTVKTGVDTRETRLLNLKSTDSSIAMEQMGRLQSGDLNDVITDSKLKVEGSCGDKCQTAKIYLVNEKSKVNLNIKVDSMPMRISNPDETQTIDSNLKDMIGKDVYVQNNLVSVPNPADATKPTNFYTLAIGGDTKLAFTMVKMVNGQNAVIQTLKALYGRKTGVESAIFSGTADQFDLTLKNKNNGVLAKLRFGPVPAPAVTTPPAATTPVADACLPVKDGSLVLTLSCYKENDANGARIKDSFVVKVKMEPTDELPNRKFNYAIDGDANSKTLTFADNKLEEILSGQKPTDKKSFMIRSSDQISAATIVLSEECCKESYQSIPEED